MKEKFSRPLALLTAAAAGVLLAGAIAVPAIVHHIRSQKQETEATNIIAFAYLGNGVWYSVTQPEENLVFVQTYSWLNGDSASYSALFAFDRDAFQFDYDSLPHIDEYDVITQFSEQIIECSDANEVIFQQTFQSTMTGSPESFAITVYGNGRIEESPEGHIVWEQRSGSSGGMEP